MADSGFWTADRMAKEGMVEVVHDFGRGFGTVNFTPAVLKGRNETIDGHHTVRPLVWGEEHMRIELPRPGFSDRHNPAPSLSISRDLSRIAASYGELVSVFELPSWRRTLILRHERTVDQLNFSPDGRFLLTKNAYIWNEAEDEIRVWDIAAETSRHQEVIQSSSTFASMEQVQECMVQAAKDALLKYSEDWTEASWLRDAQSMIAEDTKSTLAKVERRHAAAVGEFQQVRGFDLSSFGTDPWSPDGSQLLLLRKWDRERIPKGTNGMPSDLIVWDVSGAKESVHLENPGHAGPVMWSGFSPDGKWIASSSWDQKVRVWVAKTGQLCFVLQDDASNQSWTGRFSPDSNYLAVGNGDGHLRVWHAATGKLEHKVTIGAIDRQGWIRGIEFTKDSRSIFFSNRNGCAELYSLQKKQTMQRYLVKGQFPDEMQEVQVSLNGLTFGFRIQSGQMTAYNSQTNEKWQVEQTLESQRGNRTSAFGIMRFLDEEGKSAVSFDNDGILRVWKLEE